MEKTQFVFRRRSRYQGRRLSSLENPKTMRSLRKSHWLAFGSGLARTSSVCLTAALSKVQQHYSITSSQHTLTTLPN